LPFEYDISDLDELVVVCARGGIDFDSGLELGAEIPQDARFRRSYGILVDLREMDFIPEVPAVWSFARTLPALKEHYLGPVAILTQQGFIFGLARMTCLVAEASGFPMEAFNEVEKARAWLEASRLTRRCS